LTKASKQQRRAAGFLQAARLRAAEPGAGGRCRSIYLPPAPELISGQRQCSDPTRIDADLFYGVFSEYCNERVCPFLSVCVSVREHISGTTLPIFTEFLVRVTHGRAVAWSSSGSVTIRCVSVRLLPLICLSARVSQKPLHGLFCTCYL